MTVAPVTDSRADTLPHLGQMMICVMICVIQTIDLQFMMWIFEPGQIDV